MFSLARSRIATRAVAAALLLAAGFTSAQTKTVAPSAIGNLVVVEGQLEVRFEDYADGHSRLRHFLKTSQGRVELTFSGTPPQLPSGTRVRVRGQAYGDVLVLGDVGNVELLATALTGDTMGLQSIAVLLVNFQDDTSQPTTIADAQNLVFGDINNHYLESSFGQTSFDGRAFGWYTIAMSKTVCDEDQLASLADQQAAQSGVDLSAFERRVYVFPTNACTWLGSAELGGTQAWINGAMTLQVVGHELGHNYGLRHAHARNCDTGVFGNNCIPVEYGDAADLMGNGRPGQFNAFEKERLGWLNQESSPPITTVGISGRYFIEPYSATTFGPKALKIPLGFDQGRKVWYYVEYRQPIGGDIVLATTGNLTKGVIVRVATQDADNSSFQLDMSPGTSTNSFDEMADGALAVGQSHFDEVAGVTLTLVSAGSSGATIDVLFQPTCTRAAPTISLTGGGTPVTAGTNVGYTANATNRDSGGCPASTFVLTNSVPTGWTGTLGTTSLTLSPGATAKTAFNVTSNATAAIGGYGIGAAMSSPLGAQHTANTSATYTVAPPPCVRAAPKVSLSGGGTAVAAGTTVGYTLTVTNRDSSSCATTNFALARSVPAGWPSALSRTTMALSPGATDSTALNVTSLVTAAGGQYGIGAAVSSSVGALHTANASTTYLVVPKLSIADMSLVEGNSGTTMANFVVSLTQPAVVPVTFNIATANGTAAAGSDYTTTSRTGVTIPVGSKSAIVAVPIVGETAIESNETLQVVVGKVAGATVGDGTAIGTIRNDDTKLSIGDINIIEGNAGTPSATFTVKLTNVSASPVTFNIATANSTAIAGSDYAVRSLLAQSIPAGSTNYTFTVSVAGDLAVEGNEAFLVNVSGVKGAIVADAQAVATIRNDDTVLSIADASISEGNSGTKVLSFTVKLSAFSATPVTFSLATANKTAAAGSDYVALALAGQSIPAGTTSKVFSVTINGDTVREGNETFGVNVGGIAGAIVGDAQALGIIVNDD